MLQTKQGRRIVALSDFLDKDEGLGRRLMGGAWWMAIGGAASSGSSLLTSVILARMLGIARFGAYAVLASTLGVVLMLAGPSISWTSAKYVAEHRYSNPGKAARVIALTNLMALGFSLVFALVMLLGAGFITRVILALPQYRVELMVASSAVLFAGISGAQRGTLAGFHAFRTVALVNITQGALGLLLLVLLARPYGVLGAMIAQGAALGVSCVVGNIAIWREMRRLEMPRFLLPEREDFGVFRGFTLPAYLISIVAMISSWIVGVLVVRSPNGTYEMGIFGITSQILLFCMFLPSMVGQPCVPIISERLQHGAKALPAIRRLLIAMVALSFLMSIAFAAVLIVFWHSVVVMLGKGLEGYYSVVILTLLTAVIAATQGPLNYYMNARGDMWLAFFLSVLSLVASVVILLILRDSGAARAATWGRLMSYALLTPILLFYVYRTFSVGNVPTQTAR